MEIMLFQVAGWSDGRLLAYRDNNTISTTKSKNGKGKHGQRDIPTAVNGQNQQAGMAGLEPTTLVMGTSNSKPELSCCV